jgi:glycosyltransferase involved in cell wall biosynthesis
MIKYKKKSKTLCLGMIVKDEEADIVRCLDSVVDYIDYWVICDTGSKDNTVQIVRDYFESKGINGDLHEDEWLDFSTNRNKVIERATGKTDYILFMDADDYLVAKDKNPFKEIVETEGDYLECTLNLGTTSYNRCIVTKNNGQFKFKGVLHEYLCHVSEKWNDVNMVKMNSVEMVANTSPLKRFSTSNEKYYNDALILKKGIEDEPENSRYWFYLGQSFMNCNHHYEAMRAYSRRASLGGFEEEVYYSMYQAANCMAALSFPSEKIEEAYLRAWERRPHRLEALFEYMRRLNSEKRYATAYAIGKVAAEKANRNDSVFINSHIYEFGFLDELAVASFYMKDYDLCKRCVEQIEEYGSIPESEKERFEKNKHHMLNPPE